MSGTPSIPFNVNSVTLQKSHIRITRGATEDDPPFHTQNLVLWAKDGALDGNPATIPLTGATLIVNISSTNNQPFDFILLGAVQGRQIGTSQRTTYAAGAASVDVTVTIAPSVAPWGGEVQWTYNIFLGSQNWTTTTQNPIQLYAVIGEMTPMYKKSGIPQEILDLFVGQYPNTGSSSITDWITWAVTRCHASSEDPETKSLETVHSYTYNTYSGTTRFTDTEEEFDLLGWLKLRLTQSSLITINCYDQTAIVISVLSLGLPYYLRGQDGQPVTGKTSSVQKADNVTTLQRFYKGTQSTDLPPRFGYITETDLVGWGKCNNPFFYGDTNFQLITDGVGSAGFKKRESFRNHYFVCYNTLDSQGTVVQNVLDACAGPIAVPTPLNTYLEHVIDVSASQAHNGPSWNLTANVSTHPPTGTINILSLFKSINTSLYKTGILWPHIVKAQGDRPVPTAPIGASITDLSSSILSAINVTTGELDVDIAKDRSTISTEFSHLVNQKWVPFVTATIDVMTDFQSAQFQAMRRVWATERDWHYVFAIPEVAEYLGDFNLVPIKGLNIALIVYGNVVIYLEGDDSPKAQFDALVKSIDTYMTTAKEVKPTPIVPTSLSVSMPSTVSVGVPFEIEITAPGIVAVDVESKSEIVQITKGPNKITEELWTLSCVAFEKGADQVAFGFAQDGTYYPYTGMVNPVTIISPNLILNGDFQTGTLDSWTVDAGSNTIKLEQPGLNGAKYKAVASVRQGDGAPYSAVSLQQTLNTIQGRTYKLSVQFSFHDQWASDCYVNLFVNKNYVISRRSGVAGVIQDSGTFIATSNQSILEVGLLATACQNMTFDLGYVMLELVP